MASVLALSMLWILPSSTPPVSAWMPPSVVGFVPSATTKAKMWRHQHQLQPWATTCTSPSHLPMSTVTQNEESLEQMTVPELKERLRSVGQKVTGKKSDLIERLVTLEHQSNNNDSNLGDIALEEDADETNNNLEIDPSMNQLPDPLIKALVKYSSSSATEASSTTSLPKLLPIQQKSYDIIANGSDTVLFSPTGTGKTLAFILPLAARLFGWKHDGSLNHQKQAQKKRFMRQQHNQNRNKNDSLSSQSSPVDVATPSILIIEPSRELARQVGKVWSKFHPTATKASSGRQVVTVFGGVPMQRHAALMSSKTDVVIGTPGRIRELIREKYLSTSHLRSLVLDEADTLLNFKDNPEVEWLLEGMRNDYQLVLASATINKRVEKFVGEVMELEVGEDGYVVHEEGVVGTDTADADGLSLDGGIELDDVSGIEMDTSASSASKPEVQHWSMPSSAASRVPLTSDLIVTISPRRGIVFVPSKAEVESVAQALKERLSTANDVSVHTLHGDMVQAARSRTVNAFRGDTNKMTRILVATDVAARGLDLPAVDLVLQHGVPRVNGKDGTFDPELYIHRTGRAGRFGNTRTSDAIVLYDGSQGERTTLMKLQEEMKKLKGVDILARQLPSPGEVMDASYNRAFAHCEEFVSRQAVDGSSSDGAQLLVQYFADRLTEDLSSSEPTNEREEALMQRLATAMAALSGLDGAVPPRSLLTADPRDRTIRVWSDSDEALSPPAVTKVVKGLGSGKLGRITIHNDGSAVFDLGAKKAERLLASVASDGSLQDDGWHFEMPKSISIE